uniref:Uncharacterized protein n=1 Tax=Podoviridae sp. ctiwu7 TaxID=2825269 RepID=A0A8S5QB57_9CAUD|nr:MAG TPA: hypothetical protein [Podoviridae sp. ctiwu7]
MTTTPSDHLDHAVKKVSHSIFSNNSSPRPAGGFVLTTRLCFGYASPVDTAMVRPGLRNPNQ